MPLTSQRPATGDPVLDVEDEPARVLRRRQHVLSEGQKPLNVAVGVYSAVRTSVSVGRTGEPEVNALLREHRQPLAAVPPDDAFVYQRLKAWFPPGLWTSPHHRKT